jgi:catechol 2,3-dioxygenase-like lactoylglutathione lyase family enzyme
MSRYVDSTEQLVTELVVADVRRSAAFYRDLGFQLLRDDGNFLELSWEGHKVPTKARRTGRLPIDRTTPDS